MLGKILNLMSTQSSIEIIFEDEDKEGKEEDQMEIVRKEEIEEIIKENQMSRKREEEEKYQRQSNQLLDSVELVCKFKEQISSLEIERLILTISQNNLSEAIRNLEWW